MIAKHVSIKTLRKSSFEGVVKYITNEQDKHERVGSVSVTNCQSDRPYAATIEILNTQAKNRRSVKDKTYHLIVSFCPGEPPDAATLTAIEALRGDQEALAALRAREAHREFKGNTVSGPSRKPVQIHLEQDSATKKGTIIYRVGPAAVRDDGDKLTVSRGASQDGLKAALRMAMACYGERITRSPGRAWPCCATAKIFR